MSNILHSQTKIGLGNVLGDIAFNLRRVRKDKGISQSALAERSGLSRRMISAIEGGKANISIQSVDQLAAALEISFAQLVRRPAFTDTRNIGSVVWRGQDAASNGELLGTAVARNETEFWLWSLGPSDRYAATAPSDGWQEMVYVLTGVLDIDFGESTKTLHQGEFLIFVAPRSFSFANNGAHPLRFLRSVIN